MCIKFEVSAHVCTNGCQGRHQMSFPIVLCINALRQDPSLNETLTIFGELSGSACLYPQILGLQPVKPCLACKKGAGCSN